MFRWMGQILVVLELSGLLASKGLSVGLFGSML